MMRGAGVGLTSCAEYSRVLTIRGTISPRGGDRVGLHQPDGASRAACFLPQSRFLEALRLQQQIVEVVFLTVAFKQFSESLKPLQIIAGRGSVKPDRGQARG
jgi:hypothetical protein